MEATEIRPGDILRGGPVMYTVIPLELYYRLGGFKQLDMRIPLLMEDGTRCYTPHCDPERVADHFVCKAGENKWNSI